MLLRELELGSKDIPFVLVGVLKTDGPTAIKAGNKAIILGDGTIEGWVGGHCTENEIVQNALDCLKTGESRSLNLTTCQGGRMDVYMEPYLPKRKLLIFGHVPIASALSGLAHSLNFSVSVIDKSATREKFPDADNIFHSIDQIEGISKGSQQTFAVIVTMGERDQEYAEKLTRYGVNYVGVVAGKRRASEVVSYLRAAGLSEDEISRIRSPAGIYIRAVTAEEIALSIMAEITELSRMNRDMLPSYNFHEKKVEASGETSYQTDPVCRMVVEASSAEFFLEYEGNKVYFCSESCKNSFLATPQKYVLNRKN